MASVHDKKWVWKHPDWPNLFWDESALAELVASVQGKQDALFAALAKHDFAHRQRVFVENYAEDIQQSSAIEGVSLDIERLRSSLAKHLGVALEHEAQVPSQVEGVVDAAMDVVANPAAELTAERLFKWHAGYFTNGTEANRNAVIGGWRQSEVQVVSGRIAGRQTIVYLAPPPQRVPEEMAQFLHWFNVTNDMGAFLKAGMAHAWFECIHPFFDGNGRIGRNIIDLCLASASDVQFCCYSCSRQIANALSGYYASLQELNEGDLDITRWQQWFLQCLSDAMDTSLEAVAFVESKTRFWCEHAALDLSDMQRTLVNRLLAGIEGKMNPSKWAKMTKMPSQECQRDFDRLVSLGVIVDIADGDGAPDYALVWPKRNQPPCQ